MKSKIMDLKGKKVLITGGAGFIGSHITDAIIERGGKVVIVDNLSTGSRKNVNESAVFYEVNMADPKMEEIMETEKPDYVYLFAYFVLVPKSVENPLLDLDCVTGALRILQKAKKLPVKKVIFSSSGFLYGNTQNLPARETEPVMPISPYIVSKQAIEGYLKFYRSAFGVPYAVLRHAAVYGPRQQTGAMADYIRKLSCDQQAQIWGDGSKTRDYVYIDDVVDINLKVLDLPDDFVDPVFNVGTGQETTLNELYWTIAKHLNKTPRPIYLPDRPGEQVRYCLDISKAKQSLGWSTKTTLGDGLKKTISSWGLI